ncbi:MAG: oligosaccharide flippase family protein [Caldilineaceae bacterium]
MNQNQTTDSRLQPAAVGAVSLKALNFVTQVLIVRYLTKADYGAFGYALSIVALGQSFATFGLDRAITRFVPIYHEKEEYNKLFGTLIMVLTTVLSLGLGMALLFYSFQGAIGDTWIKDQLAVELLLILIFWRRCKPWTSCSWVCLLSLPARGLFSQTLDGSRHQIRRGVGAHAGARQCALFGWRTARWRDPGDCHL